MIYPFWRKKEKEEKPSESNYPRYSRLSQALANGSLMKFGIKTVNNNDDYYIEPRYINPYRCLGRDLDIWNEMLPKVAFFEGKDLRRITLSDGSYFYKDKNEWKVCFEPDEEGRYQSHASQSEIERTLLSELPELKMYILTNCNIIHDPKVSKSIFR